MKTAKEEVQALLETLPDDASMQDIQYHLYVRQKVQKGLEAAEQGRTLTHEEAVRRMARWLYRQSGRSRRGMTLTPPQNTSRGTPSTTRRPSCRK